MPTAQSLPENPDLGQLRRQARALQRAARAGDPAALARITRWHPGGVPADPAALRLSTAQLVIARQYGFASWPRLRHYLDLVTRLGWDATPAHHPATDPADEFCRLACLSYTPADGPSRWAAARRLLAERPELARDQIWAAAAAAEADTVRRLLAGDPGLARRRGGPFRWAPLSYLAYSRVDPEIPAEPVLAVARMLLAAGGDPDEGYLWNGRPYPFTLLTGVFGEGELGPRRQPPHPHQHALARLLLAAGANPNDSQALYNRQFQAADDHLELLFEYGLGTGADHPWRSRLGDLVDRPAELLRVQLRWAVQQGFTRRVRLLVRHGVDFRSAYHPGPGTVAWLPDDGRTPVELAALAGHTGIVEFLVSRGAPPPELDPAERLVAAAFRGDRAAVAAVRAAHPRAVTRLREQRAGLIVWAAANGRGDVVDLLAELGFDVNARGRGDVPVEQAHSTALHQAAGRGDLRLARRLLALGADPRLRDAEWDATPLDWALHLQQDAMVALLAPLTRNPAGRTGPGHHPGGTGGAGSAAGG